MKSYLKKCLIMIIKRSTGNFHVNDLRVLLNGSLITQSSKTGFSRRESQVYGAPEKVGMLSIFLVCNTNGLMCASWIWKNHDSVSPTNYSLQYNGLTISRTAVIDAAKFQPSESESPIIFFYCDYEYHGKLDASCIISSLIKQICEYLYQKCGRYPEDVTEDLHKFFGLKRTKPDFDDLQYLFSQLFRGVLNAVYVIDGIDALQEGHAISILTFIQQLFSSSDTSQKSRILLLSRDQVPGYINIGTFIRGIREIPMSTNAMQDIEHYIETRVIEKMMHRKLTDNVSLLRMVKEILLIESSNMYEADTVS